jgi:sigma-B regulation protein RsbU (phosphoserine phosphatase)
MDQELDVNVSPTAGSDSELEALRGQVRNLEALGVEAASAALDAERRESTLSTAATQTAALLEAQTRELSQSHREMKLAEEDRRLAAVAFESHDSMMITDRNGEILRVNGGFTKMTGYSLDDVYGRTPRVLRSGRHSRAFYRQMWTAIHDDGYWSGELWNRRKDGHVYPQRLTITRVTNELGEVTHYVGSGHDMSEAKQAEADRQSIAVARKIQQGLFPSSVPRVPGFDIAGAVYPADRVSGDYFDYLSLGPQGLGVLVADVCGHGLGAALLMAQTQAHLRALAESHLDPGALLTHTNRLFAMSHSDLFVTLFLGRLDLASSSFIYAGAGHQAYLLGGHGTRTQLESTSTPLGVRENAIISAAPAVVLKKGDIILLPTDGIEEATNPDGECFGRARMLDVLERNRDKTAAEIVKTLYRAAREFAGGAAQRDDMTIVVLKKSA